MACVAPKKNHTLDAQLIQQVMYSAYACYRPLPRCACFIIFFFFFRQTANGAPTDNGQLNWLGRQLRSLALEIISRGN